VSLAYDPLVWYSWVGLEGAIGIGEFKRGMALSLVLG
jgi:hypothetical protein